MTRKQYNVAVIGATGNVGRETLNILAERKFPINNVYATASLQSVGKELSFGHDTIKVVALDDLNFSEIDIAFFCAGSEVSKKYAEKAAASNCVVIDKSSFFRLHPEVPLIVPEVNLASLKDYKAKNIIASPNCCTIPLVLALKPLDNFLKIKRAIVSTYQSTSGAGKAGMDELYNQTKARYVFTDIQPEVFPKQIAFNLFPHIGNFNNDGSTEEETKIEKEWQKIIGTNAKCSVTCVRVPVFVGHCLSVNVEFEEEANIKEVEKVLLESSGLKVVIGAYATPLEVVGEDVAYVSRIRKDNSLNTAINMWITVDNTRKGAAINSVQIAQELIKML